MLGLSTTMLWQSGPVIVVDMVPLGIEKQNWTDGQPQIKLASEMSVEQKQERHSPQSVWLDFELQH